MKVSAFFSVALSLLSAAVSLASPLEARTPDSLPSLLKKPGTFYRAVTGGEMAHATSIYRKGAHPANHTTMAGDYSNTGGLYVFADINEAKTWGSCWAKVHPVSQKWYLIVLHYTPNPRLKTLTFTTGSDEWRKFVQNSYNGGNPHYDIVEGPISTGSGSNMRPYLNHDTDQMVWEAAFVGQDALQTLTVEEMTLNDERSGNTRWCNIS